MFLEAVIGTLTLVIGIYIWLTWHYGYWKSNGVPFIQPQLLFGNTKNMFLMTQDLANVYDVLYWKYPEFPAVGIFNMRQPQLLIRDPELVKAVLIKEFNSFHDNVMEVDPKIDPIIGNNPFVTRGDNWKKSRAIHTPALTTLKLKTMIPLISNVCKDMIDYVNKNLDTPIEAKYLCGQFTTDVVASCVFGVTSNSFKDPEATFRKMSAKVFASNFKTNMKFLMIHYFPDLAKFLKLKFLPNEVSDFFSGVIKDTIVYRQKNGIKRNDFLQQLINEQEKNDKAYTLDQIVAFTMTFFFDGYETSSVLISYILYNLAIHPDVQNKLRSEIQEAIPNLESVDFDLLCTLPYLDAVVSETLRLYPPGSVMTKLCTNSITLKAKGMEFPVSKGQTVSLPIFSIQRDQNNFPEPLSFKPERFQDKNYNSEAYFPFGLGPRACLGQRFALTQTKMAIVNILYFFNVLPKDKIPQKIEFDPLTSILLTVKGGLWIKFIPLYSKQ